MIGSAQPVSGDIQYDLLLDTLRQLVLTGKNPDKVHQILSRTDILDQLGPEQLLSWATCAQIAGHDQIVRQTYKHLHVVATDLQAAWSQHRDYLQDMGDGTALAALRAQCREFAPQFLELFQTDMPKGRGDDKIPEEPFATMHDQARLLALYMEIFRGREDCFARQWANKGEGKSGYTPVRQPMTEQDIRDHLSGQRTYGIYLMQANGQVRLGVIDADLNKDLRQNNLDTARRNEVRRELAYLLEHMVTLAREQGLECILEFSGSKGYHFWFPFDTPVNPAQVRACLQFLVSQIAPDLSCFSLEVFPKQDTLSGKGLGNLVKLPLGIHRLSGKPSRFLPGQHGDTWQQLEKLKPVKINSASVLGIVPAGPKPVVVDHPGYAKWKKDYPALGILAEACPLLAGLFSLCRQGKPLSVREERVLYGVIGFLEQRKLLLHALLGAQSEYNPHLVDYRISRLRGTPLGCKKIHDLLESRRDFCVFPAEATYHHPLVFVPGWSASHLEISSSAANLQDALNQLQQSLTVVSRFLPLSKGEG